MWRFVLWQTSIDVSSVSAAYIIRSHRTFFLWRCGPTRTSFLRFLDHTKRRITVGRTPLDEWSPRRRDLYVTTHNTHNRQTWMSPVRFEPTISAGERPQTYALDSAATGIGLKNHLEVINILRHVCLQTSATVYQLLLLRPISVNSGKQMEQ